MLRPLLGFSRLALEDAVQKTQEIYSKDRHFQAAVEWLIAAHDHTSRQGVSYGYSIEGGWRPPYRETTGYILVTFYRLAEILGDASFADRATAMANWEISVQNTDGSFSNPAVDPDNGIVFDTGQVLFGLVKAWEKTADKRFLDAAIRAGTWLVDVADEKGCWTRKTHNGIPHTYNTRSAWALLRLNQANPQSKWVEIATANLDFAVDQLQNGWFRQCAFTSHEAPFTHTIAYAIRGLLESYLITGNKTWLSAAETVADSCILSMRDDGYIAGKIALDGTNAARYCCLTGNCQLSIVWAKLSQILQQESYQDNAVTALQFVMARQRVNDSSQGIRGAIAGSAPVWGGYSRLTFPNWATKFFVDAMIESWDALE